MLYQSQYWVQCACHLIAILCHDLVVGFFLSSSHPDHKTWSREIIDFSFFDQLANFCPNFHLIVALPIFPLPWSVEDTGCGTAHQRPWPLRYIIICSRMGNSSHTPAINAVSRSKSKVKNKQFMHKSWLPFPVIHFNRIERRRWQTASM